MPDTSAETGTRADDAAHDTSSAERDTGARRQTALVWLGIAAFVVLWTFVLGQAILALRVGDPLLNGNWLISADIWPPIRGGRTMLYGGWLVPYALNPNLVAMPLYPVVTLPLAAVVEIFSIPNPVVGGDFTATATAATSDVILRANRSPLSPISVGWYLLWLVPFLITVRSLAWELGVRRRLWSLQIAAFAIGWFPMVVIFAHVEDGLIVTLAMYAIVLTKRKQWTQVAIALTLALSLKQTAALVAPLFFFFVPKGHRLRFALVTVSLPVALVAIVLLADFASASKALFFAPTFPGAGSARPTWFTTATDGTITAGPIRIGAPILALAVALWLRRNRSLLLLMAGVGLAFAVRLPFEAVMQLYYAAPVYVFAAVYEKRRNGRTVWAPVAGFLAMATYWVNGFVGVPFWAVQVPLFAAATWPLFVDVARRRFGGPDGEALEMPECGVGAPAAADADGAPRIESGREPDADAAPDDRAEAPPDGVIL